MRIAFVSQVSPSDRSALSGSAFQVLEVVRATGVEIEVVSPLMKKWRMQAMRIASIPARLSGHGMAWPKHPFLLKSYAKLVDRAVEEIKPDLVFSPGTNVIAYSSFLKPTVFWSDAPFGAMMDYYPWPQYQRLTEKSRRDGLAADTRSLKHASAGIYRSNWARQRAIEKHHADPNRVHVLPLPGNVIRRWTLEDVRNAVEAKLKVPWKILFSGVDWKRKGGDRAVAILNELVRLGQPCEMRVVGVNPPARSVLAAKFPVYSFGRQNLNDPQGQELLGTLMQEAAFLLVPSTAETFGFVFCEALSAGVPSVGTDTGGVSDVITEGKTGLLMDPNESPIATAQRILKAGQPEAYRAMAEACWIDWHARFEIGPIVKRLRPILEQAVSEGPRAR